MDGTGADRVIRNFGKSGALAGIALTATMAISGCGQKEEVAVAPPPPPAPVLIPPRPTPPNNASLTMTVPPMGADGQFYSVNRNISSAQALWNMRSAFNVAALNCREPRHASITDAYRIFLTRHGKALTAANKAVDGEFRSKYGGGWIAAREKYMTEVYNHYALPPTVPQFCNAMQAFGQESLLVEPSGLSAFAARSLPNIEAVFDDFFRRYVQYRADLATWDAQYGPPQAPVIVPASASGPASGTTPAPIVLPAATTGQSPSR